MTFEEYVFNYIKNSVGYDLKTTVKDDSISLDLEDGNDVNRFVRESTFLLVMRFKGKRTSAQASEAVKRAFRNLGKENYVMGSNLISEHSSIEGEPSFWEYGVTVLVRHRNRDNWS